MANLEVLALDTAVPQIRAPGAGDGYSVPRDMTMASGTTLSAQALTAAGNVTLSGGTANGVLYLNASKVATSGSALTFDGTTLTSSALTVSGASTLGGSTDKVIINRLSDATAYGSVTFNGLLASTTMTGLYGRGSGGDSGSLFYTVATGTQHVWQIAGSEFMRLNSTGLGIGTASPSAKLHVETSSGLGAFIGNSDATNGFGLKITAGGSASSRYALHVLDPTDTTSYLIVSTATGSVGNVGIGTTSPAARVDIRGSGAQTLYFVSTTGSNQTNVIASLFSNGAAYSNLALEGNTLLFRSGTSATEAARIDSSGNLGIGTSSPQSGGLSVFAGTAIGATTPGVVTIGENSTTVQSGEVLGRIQFYSSDASTSMSGVVGKIDCLATGNFAGTAPTALTFHTNDGVAGTIAERARITAAGELLVGVNTATANGGVIQVSNGITFPATQSASSNANTLDDYEEGTWTGTLKGSTTDPTTPVTATGKYTKIGRQVTVAIYFNNVDTTGAAGGVSITGLPFSEDGTTAVGTAATYLFDFPAGLTSLWTGFSGTVAYIVASGDNAVWDDVVHSAGAGRYLRMTGTYFV